jgi:hypothetical protein
MSARIEVVVAYHCMDWSARLDSVGSGDTTQCGGGAGVPAQARSCARNVAKVAHVNPAATGGAFDEMFSLILRFAAAPFGDDLARHGP